MLGLGLNWNRPNESSDGADLDDQYALELFQLLQLTAGIAITPSAQIIHNPALNPSDDWSASFGLRVRIAP